MTKSGRYETVYNLRVKQDRTYFVGKQSWGFSIWVHNTYTIRDLGDGKFQILDENNNPLPRIFRKNEVDKLINELNAGPQSFKNLTDAEKKKYFRNAVEKINEEAIVKYRGEVPPNAVERAKTIHLSEDKGGLGAGKARTVGIAEIDISGSGKTIDGKSIDEIKEIAGISGGQRDSIPKDWIKNNPDSKVAPSVGESHAEDNILGLLREYLDADPNASGTVKLYINHPEGKGPCHRCSPKIKKFIDEFGDRIKFEYSY